VETISAEVADLVRGLTDPVRSGRIAAPAALEMDEGYRVQAAVFAALGRTVAAWKIGLTSEAAQHAHGTCTPAAGRLSANALFRSGARVSPPPGEVYVEAELVVEMGSDLPHEKAPFDCEAVAAAIGPVYAAIEIASTRFADSDLCVGALVADNCMADRLVIGDTLAHSWDTAFADCPVTLEVGSHTVVSGSTAAVMGNPLLAVAWLANWLAGQGLGLERGQRISTGTCTGITEAGAGDTVVACFVGLGSVTFDFTT